MRSLNIQYSKVVLRASFEQFLIQRHSEGYDYDLHYQTHGSVYFL